jgi:hypothetical protein
MSDVVHIDRYRAIGDSRAAAEADLDELSSANLLLMSVEEQREAIGRMRLLRASLVMLQREDVQHACSGYRR